MVKVLRKTGALICFVRLIAIGNGLSLAWNFEPISVVKSEMPWLTKGILIFDLTPNKNGLLLSPNISKFWISERATLGVCPGAYYEISNADVLTELPRTRVEDIQLCPHASVVGGRLPGVFESVMYMDLHIPPRGRSNETEPAAIPKNISAQLPLSGTHHYAYSGNESEKLQQRDNTSNDSNFVTKSPSIAPVFWPFLLVSYGFWLCLLGRLRFDNGRRRLVGVALFGMGSLLGEAGILPWGFWW